MGQRDLFKIYMYSIEPNAKIKPLKKQLHNECNFLTSRPKITLDGLACH